MGGLAQPTSGQSTATATGMHTSLPGGAEPATAAPENPIAAFFDASRYTRDDVIVMAAAVQLLMVFALVVAEVTR